jgi:hypothetical protein
VRGARHAAARPAIPAGLPSSGYVRGIMTRYWDGSYDSHYECRVSAGGTWCKTVRVAGSNTRYTFMSQGRGYFTIDIEVFGVTAKTR